MKTLITGSSGLIGSGLAGLLGGRGGAGLHLADIRRYPGSQRGRFHKCDFEDPQAVKRLVRLLRPERIYHLAGRFFGDYECNYGANVLPAKHIFDAVREFSPHSRVLVTGSAAEYGCVRKNPVREDAPLQPINPYGFSKMLQTRLAEFYVRVYGLDIVIARPFNIIGPGASEKLFAGRIYAQMDAYKKGLASKILVGRLDAFRDYIGVYEAAEHLRTIMKWGLSGAAYNVGSGRPVRMKDLLVRLLKENGMTFSAVNDNRPAFSAGKEVPKIYADITRLKRLTPHLGRGE